MLPYFLVATRMDRATGGPSDPIYQRGMSCPSLSSITMASDTLRVVS